MVKQLEGQKQWDGHVLGEHVDMCHQVMGRDNITTPQRPPTHPAQPKPGWAPLWGGPAETMGHISICTPRSCSLKLQKLQPIWTTTHSQHPTPTTHHALPITHHPSPATHHPSPTTHCTPTSTHHPLVTTLCTPTITHQPPALPPNTHCTPTATHHPPATTHCTPTPNHHPPPTCPTTLLHQHQCSSQQTAYNLWCIRQNEDDQYHYLCICNTGKRQTKCSTISSFVNEDHTPLPHPQFICAVQRSPNQT